MKLMKQINEKNKIHFETEQLINLILETTKVKNNIEIYFNEYEIRIYPNIKLIDVVENNITLFDYEKIGVLKRFLQEIEKELKND